MKGLTMTFLLDFTKYNRYNTFFINGMRGEKTCL